MTKTIRASFTPSRTQHPHRDPQSAKHQSAAYLLGAFASLLTVATLAAQPSQQRELTDEDAGAWKNMSDAQLTADGQWLVYRLRPTSWLRGFPRTATIVIRSTRSPTEYRIAAGDESLGGGSELMLAASGHWIAFKKAASLENLEHSNARRPTEHTSVVAVNVRTGNRREFPNVQRFSFNGQDGRWIALQSYPAKPNHTAGSSADVNGGRGAPAIPTQCIAFPTMYGCERNASQADLSSELMLWKLGSETPETLTHVSEFSFDKPGNRLAWTDEHGLQIRDLESGSTRVLDPAANAQYRTLIWSDSGDSLAVLKTPLSSASVPPISSCPPDMERQYSLLVFSNLRKGKLKEVTLTANDGRGLPTGFEISPDSASAIPFTFPYGRLALTWRDNEEGLFLGVRPKRTDCEQHEPNPGDSSAVVWHARDPRLPGRKKFDASGEKRLSYLGYFSLRDGHFVQLADPTLANVQVHRRSRYLLGFDSRQYDLQFDTTGRLYRDYYSVDIFTGKRTVLAEHLEVPAYPFNGIEPQLSPDGRFALYLDMNRGDYIAHDLTRSVTVNLTAAIDIKFYDAENLRDKAYINRRQHYPVIQGWSHDGARVLLTDGYDVWSLPLKGGRAINLTGNGASEHILYVRTDFAPEGDYPAVFPYDETSQFVNLNEPIYFSAIDEKTQRTGLTRWVPGKSTLDSLHWEDARIRYQKARTADVYVYTRQTAVEFPDFHLVDKAWRPTIRLTDINPQQNEFLWSPGVRLLTYANQHGELLEAVLHLPANYAPGKRYPTIVGVYERQGDTLHDYWAPSGANGGMDVSRLTRNGYAVLLPDIKPHVRIAGAKAVEDVTAGVNAAVTTGIVDHDRLGVTGTSYGGYETNFIITQTNLFKAAVAANGYTDLLSGYGAVYLDRIPSASLYEVIQPYLGVPWWQSWKAFVDNSPVFQADRIQTPLLLIHGDADSAVSFSQSVELFNTLRRLGHKDVVLIQYQGEGHGLREQIDVLDCMRRELGFFDYFLKGDPAPPWWSDGKSSF